MRRKFALKEAINGVTQPLNYEEIAIKGIYVRAQGAVVR